LLVFDEATSSLDSLTEDEVSRTIRDVARAQDGITILIAHRLSTIMHATDFCFGEGPHCEAGRHDELLDNKGLYYAMWRSRWAKIRCPRFRRNNLRSSTLFFTTETLRHEKILQRWLCPVSLFLRG